MGKKYEERLLQERSPRAKGELLSRRAKSELEAELKKTRVAPMTFEYYFDLLEPKQKKSMQQALNDLERAFHPLESDIYRGKFSHETENRNRIETCKNKLKVAMRISGAFPDYGDAFDALIKTVENIPSKKWLDFDGRERLQSMMQTVVAGVTFDEYLQRLPLDHKSAIWSSVQNLATVRNSGGITAMAKAACLSRFEMAMDLVKGPGSTGLLSNRRDIRCAIEALDQTICDAIGEEKAVRHVN